MSLLKSPEEIKKGERLRVLRVFFWGVAGVLVCLVLYYSGWGSALWGSLAVGVFFAYLAAAVLISLALLIAPLVIWMYCARIYRELVTARAQRDEYLRQQAELLKMIGQSLSGKAKD